MSTGFNFRRDKSQASINAQNKLYKTSNEQAGYTADERADYARSCAGYAMKLSQFSKGDHVLVSGAGKGTVIDVDSRSVRVKIGLANAKAYHPDTLTKV